MRNCPHPNGKYSSVYYRAHVFILSLFPPSFVKPFSSFAVHRNARLHFYIHIKPQIWSGRASTLTIRKYHCFFFILLVFNHFKLLQWVWWFKQMLFDSMFQTCQWPHNTGGFIFIHMRQKPADSAAFLWPWYQIMKRINIYKRMIPDTQQQPQENNRCFAALGSRRL